MLSYIIRLDDACPTMNHEKWMRMEKLLDKYNVKPIVGVIPDCKDMADDFQNEEDPLFWDKAKAWQEKGWVIAQHGLNHSFHDTPKGTKYYQLNIGDYTEFAGESLEVQKQMIKEGYDILKRHDLEVTCFFAPAHTYDINTVKACKELGFFKFISDGYALRPFKKDGMIFMPSIFDTPHKILPFGVYTFVFHPSKMDESGFVYLENFLKTNKSNFKNILNDIDFCSICRKQGILGCFIEISINAIRRLNSEKT